MPISKKTTYIAPGLVDGAADPLRNQTKSHWVTIKPNSNSVKPNLMYLAKDKKVGQSTLINGRSYSEETDNDNTALPSKRVTMRVYGNSRLFENQQHWNAFVLGGQYGDQSFSPLFQTGQLFKDHTFSVDMPFSNVEAKEIGGTAVKTSDVNLEYNYYQESYETMMTRISDEKLIPNLYALYSLKEGSVDGATTRRNRIFRTHVSLAGRLDTNQMNKFTDKGSENPLASNSLQYLESFSRAINNRSFTENIDAYQQVATAYQNVMLSPGSVSMLKYNNKKEMFPMYSEITFATDKTTQFTQILKDSNAGAIFMKDLYGATVGGIPWPSTQDPHLVATTLPFEKDNNLGEKNIDSVMSIRQTNVRMWNVEDWLKQFNQNAPSDMQTGIFIGQDNKELQMAYKAEYGFYKKMVNMIFAGKLRTLVKSQQRRFEDILDGDSCYSEEVMYKVEKFLGESNTPIQTFWLANTNEVDVINFIDTQVKFGQRYRYVATVYNLVIGSTYVYNNISTTRRVTNKCVEFVDSLSDKPVIPRVPGHIITNNVSGVRTALEVPGDKRFMAEVDVTVFPNVFIAETPFFVHSGRLIDDPPLAPEIDILPYRTDSRFLKFVMQGSTGHLTMDPIIIDAADRQMVDMIRRAKNLNNHSPIMYSSDDHPAFFQVYRMDEAPRKYADFEGKIRKTVSTDISLDTPQKATATAYVDQIRSNQKYYYMFRAIDIHNKIGAPTAVYEVEMVNDKGAFYPVVRIYDMDTKHDVTAVKTGRRFIQVIPNIEQTLINESKSGFEDVNSAKDIMGNLTYGYSQDSIWNKKFKLRLTSKKTGKKIDINLRFKTERVKTDLEESS